MKKIYSMLLLGALIFVACKPEDTCMMVPSPPDLTMEFEALNGTEIPAGSNFELRATTWNHKDPNNCAGTKTAVDVVLQFIIEYRADNFAPFDTINIIDKSIGSIDGGESVENNFSFLFSVPGAYRITGLVDTDNLIMERDETNNVFTAEQIGTQ